FLYDPCRTSPTLVQAAPREVHQRVRGFLQGFPETVRRRPKTAEDHARPRSFGIGRGRIPTGIPLAFPRGHVTGPQCRLSPSHRLIRPRPAARVDAGRPPPSKLTVRHGRRPGQVGRSVQGAGKPPTDT
ncbi:hypothetical protein PanWU01x14_155430, partial [Parasponia andersonii]